MSTTMCIWTSHQKVIWNAKRADRDKSTFRHDAARNRPNRPLSPPKGGLPSKWPKLAAFEFIRPMAAKTTVWGPFDHFGPKPLIIK